LEALHEELYGLVAKVKDSFKELRCGACFHAVAIAGAMAVATFFRCLRAGAEFNLSGLAKVSLIAKEGGVVKGEKSGELLVSG
jgi:hypothetical protein